ncbi:MAG: phosphatase PAP2 family protein [Candidatus Krumholzibacteriota bacterium]
MKMAPQHVFIMVLFVALFAGGAAVAVENETDTDTDTVSETESENRNVLDDALHGGKILVHDTAHILVSPFRMGKRDALQLGAILATTGIFLVFDEEIHGAVTRNADEFPVKPLAEVGRFLDPLGYGSMNVYYFGGLGASYAAGWDTGTAMFGQILTSFAVYGILKRPVEAVVGRSRPYEGEGAYSFGNSDATSFFSGHTINIFQLATITSHHVARPWFTWLAYFGAGSVAVQRIESDAHWPSDVFLSAAFAVAVSRGVIALHEGRKMSVVPHAGNGGAGVALVWRF